MEKAKQAVSNFISGDGHHKTTVHEDVNRPVTEEQVHTHRHENVTTAVDREVHQDHHHTTVQPVKAQETLPEKHHHNVVPVAHKTYEHGSDKDTKDILDREAAKFKNTSTTHDTTHTSTTAPAVTGERVHHHVHEHIQPVIQKDTIQPHVVHTTVPIHETHHAKPVHHGTTVLPAKTLDEFSRERGTLDGPHQHKQHEFDGCPDKMNKDFKSSEHAGIAGMHHDHHHHDSKATAGAAAAVGGVAAASHKTHGTDTRGTAHHGADSLAAAKTANARGNERTGILHGTHTTTDHDEGNYSTSGGPRTATHGTAALNKAEPRFGSNTTGASHTETSHTGSVDANGKKVSLVDKLNPFKDADGDGHKGIMS